VCFYGQVLPFQTAVETANSLEDDDFDDCDSPLDDMLSDYEIHAFESGSCNDSSSAEGELSAHDSFNALRLIHRAGKCGAAAKVLGCLLHAYHVEDRDIAGLSSA
jgi:hypothetical protein